MTEKRLTVNDITSDQLDALYERLEYAAHVAADERGRAFTAERRADEAEAALDRVRHLAERWQYTADRKKTALPELRTALNGPTPDAVITTEQQLTTDQVAALTAHIKEHGLTDLPFGAKARAVTGPKEH
ncbi:hypothetical protein ACFVTT_38565 [Streptomyces niveus]|uniref:hypothetical protein n=1 Tax=Streptomyces niveus TaxID=193462 RepID=UPI00344349F0